MPNGAFFAAWVNMDFITNKVNFKKCHRQLLSLFVYFLVVFSSVQAFALDNEINEFTSDGCSMSPDGFMDRPNDFISCCVKHDIAYWHGGTSLERQQADEDLKQCLISRDYPRIAIVYFWGVRFGGSNKFKTSYRWGYGWVKNRPYGALNKGEQNLVRRKLSEVNWVTLYQKLYTPFSYWSQE